MYLWQRVQDQIEKKDAVIHEKETVLRKKDVEINKIKVDRVCYKW